MAIATSPPAPAPKSNSRSRRRRLRRASLPIDTIELARYLVGISLVSTLDGVRVSGRIVETEAYPLADSASHAFRGLTNRTAAMFERHGVLYVYRIYGTSWCANIVSEARGKGAAVLVRALVPLDGAEAIAARRSGVAERDWLRGPGRLAAALGLSGAHDGLDLCKPGTPIWLEDDGTRPEIGVSTRIGLSRGADAPLRFYARGSRFLSGRAALSP